MPEAVLKVGGGAGPGARTRRNHIGLTIRAFLRLEHHSSTTGVSWYEAKARIIRYFEDFDRFKAAIVECLDGRVKPTRGPAGRRNWKGPG